MTVVFIRLCAILLLHLFLLGCEKPPTDTIIKAQRLVEEAKAVEADIYAHETFLKADEALKKAKGSVAVRAFKEAGRSGIEAAQLADEAIALAKAKKNTLRKDAEQRVVEIRRMLDELRVYAEKNRIRRLKKGTADIRELIEKYEANLSVAEDALQKQEIWKADSELKALGDLVAQMKENIFSGKEAHR